MDRVSVLVSIRQYPQFFIYTEEHVKGLLYNSYFSTTSQYMGLLLFDNTEGKTQRA